MRVHAVPEFIPVPEAHQGHRIVQDLHATRRAVALADALYGDVVEIMDAAGHVEATLAAREKAVSAREAAADARETLLAIREAGDLTPTVRAKVNAMAVACTQP